MAALAYLFPPISKLVVYFMGRDERVRWHGMQAVVFGLVWPLALYGCSQISPGATQVAFFAGGAMWLMLLVLTAFGLNPRVPGTGSLLTRLAADPPR